MNYRYWSVLRPVGPGTYPKKESNLMMGYENYEKRRFVRSIGKEAWGWLEFEKPLAPNDIDSYDLIPDGGTKMEMCVSIPVKMTVWAPTVEAAQMKVVEQVRKFPKQLMYQGNVYEFATDSVTISDMFEW